MSAMGPYASTATVTPVVESIPEYAPAEYNFEENKVVSEIKEAEKAESAPATEDPGDTVEDTVEELVEETASAEVQAEAAADDEEAQVQEESASAAEEASAGSEIVEAEEKEQTVAVAAAVPAQPEKAETPLDIRVPDRDVSHEEYATYVPAEQKVEALLKVKNSQASFVIINSGRNNGDWRTSILLLQIAERGLLQANNSANGRFFNVR